MPPSFLALSAFQHLFGPGPVLSTVGAPGAMTDSAYCDSCHPESDQGPPGAQSESSCPTRDYLGRFPKSGMVGTEF